MTSWDKHLAATDAALLTQRSELHQELRMARAYLASAAAPRNTEASTRAYRAHRNRRQATH